MILYCLEKGDQRMTIQIVTDSTAYFTKEEIEEYDIKIVPLQINFQGRDSFEGFPGEFDSFFHTLEKSKDFPTTSQPSAGAFAKVFQEAIEEDKEVLAVLISSKLSGTYNSAVLGANMVDSQKITVVDSLTAVGNLRHLVIEAQKMALEGKSRLEILNYIEDQKTRMGIYLTVETLDYLKKGGRLSSTQALMGSILNVKPILQLKDGVIEPVTKVRGKKKAMKAIIESVPEDAKNVYIPHILNEEDANEIKKILQEKLPHAKVELTVLGPVIGAHLGIKAIGVCFTY